ncbi:MAG TPA: glutamyl-tRNA reductase, partial [Blastocatellia bacterium]|nr:glutamyl-tRNA reductase [Blastocatellia bacterium]
MSIILLGINHHTAPVEVRERLAFSEAELPTALQTMIERQAAHECLIVSTCNRVEVIAETANAQQLRDFVCELKRLPLNFLDSHLVQLSDTEAIKHTFRVASSLDSMIVGEPQILGQIKDAFQIAQSAGTVGHTLTRLMNRAFAVAKKVRNETGIAANAVSISYVAVELARKVFDSLQGTTVLLLGAGEMAELAAKHFTTNGAKKLLIANRTFANAQALAAEMNGEAVSFDSLDQRLVEADIVLCSTGAAKYLLTSAQIEQVLEKRRYRPLFLIDISVPRNIDPAISNLDNAFVFDIDDLQAVAEANLQERQREAERAEIIVAAEAERFAASLTEGNLSKVIGVFRHEMLQLAVGELERSRKRLGSLTPEQEEALHIMLNSIVNKFTHPIIKQLRESEDGHSSYLEVFREFYHREKD